MKKSGTKNPGRSAIGRTLIAAVVAVRQALDYRSTLRAIGVCTIGFPIYAISILVSLLWVGPWPI